VIITASHLNPPHEANHRDQQQRVPDGEVEQQQRGRLADVVVDPIHEACDHRTLEQHGRRAEAADGRAVQLECSVSCIDEASDSHVREQQGEEAQHEHNA
jgi:hypothetical protein